MTKLPFTKDEKAKILDAIANALDIFVVTEKDNETIRYANAATTKKLGYKPEDLIGQPVSILFKNQNERRYKILPVVLKRGSIENYEVVLRTADGEDLHTSATIARIVGGGTVGSGKDISKEVNSDREKQTMLYNILEFGKPYQRGHGQRVCDYSCLIADKMGVNHKIRTILEQGAPIHDFGKLEVEDYVLTNRKRLRAYRNKQLREHPAAGDELLLRQHQSFYKPEIRALVRWHHERPDGKGYPDHLRGNEIPLQAKIVGVADAFDAMTSDRPYRKARSISWAKMQIKKYAGTQFDAYVAEAFLKIPESKLEKVQLGYR